MNRKIAIIIIVILAIFAGAVIAYILLRSAGPDAKLRLPSLPFIGPKAPIGAPPPPPPQAAPSEKEARLRQIIDRPILAPTLSADGQSILFVERINGHITRSDFEGKNEQAIADLTILEAFEGAWSPSKTKIALSYREAGVVKRFVEGTSTTTPSRFLPSGVTSFSWSPDGKSMAYFLAQGEKTNLVVADEKGQKARTIFSTPIPDFNVHWVSKNDILLVTRPSGFAPSLLMRLDQNGQSAASILIGSQGVVALPLPDGSGFALSRSSGKGEAEELLLYSFKNNSVLPLGGTVTMAEKCALAQKAKRLYCGVPRGEIPAPSPDEWYKDAVSFADNLAMIDPATGEANTAYDALPGIDIISPFFSQDEKFIFFQDKKTGTLWRLTL